MLIALHRNAVTTPRQREYIRTSPLSVSALAGELGVSETTIRRWRHRSDGADRSSRPHRLSTSLSAEEEEVAVELRCRLDLSLDDALGVLHRCIRPDISRSALYRLWRRRGIAAPGTVRNFVREAGYRHQMTNRSPKVTANWLLASPHSRGGRFHSSAA